MVEKLIEEKKLEFPTESLHTVLRPDYYLAIHKLLREMYVRNFDKVAFDSGILKTYEWLKTKKDDEPLPDFAKPFDATLKLYQELSTEIKGNNKLLVFEPVAYALKTTELIDDLKKEVKCPPEIFLRPHLSLLEQDEPFSKLFRQYWDALKGRANFLAK